MNKTTSTTQNFKIQNSKYLFDFPDLFHSLFLLTLSSTQSSTLDKVQIIFADTNLLRSKKLHQSSDLLLRYSHSTSTNLSSFKMTQFLDLPAEVRLKIFQYVAYEEMCKTALEKVGPNDEEVRRFFITPWAGIARANKLMNDEVTDALTKHKPPCLRGARIETLFHGGTYRRWSRHGDTSRTYTVVLDSTLKTCDSLQDLCVLRLYNNLQGEVSAISAWAPCRVDAENGIVTMNAQLDDANILTGHSGRKPVAPKKRELILKSLDAQA